MFVALPLGLVLVSTIALGRWVPHHLRWRPLVVALNLAVTVRYLWWRGAETLNWDGGWGTAFSLVAYAAELYGFFGLLHHYSIATRSLERTSPPVDAGSCPSVDIMIASYNETADILTRTIVGCQAIEYPNKTIHLLDDGRRPEIARLCRQLGVNYIARTNNAGAKAGNLNHALAHTSGEFIVTFDADHVPVSSFLAETLGHFRDDGVALVQTPQHFYNPDIFQNCLRSQEYVANEQAMFFRIVQPGRDVDNASFYCGSGAVLRRAALDDIGGFPMTTITEDMHASLLLHSRGWKTVYVNKNLSAGLAPESFEAYLTQRLRWSHGTMQVMLLRRGLFLPGLTAKQRIHYFATLWYWLYGLPRVIYLACPLVFLLFGVKPLVVGDISELFAYYVPHLLVSMVAFQLVSGGTRRMFWSDIYESCVAVPLASAALMFPWSGRRVHFAVTPKGHDAERRARRGAWRQGWAIAALAILMCAALLKGASALTAADTDRGSMLVNLSWAAYNLVVLSFGLLLLRQKPQRRTSPRLPRTHACRLWWSGGSIEGVSMDISETGLSLRLTKPQPLPHRLDVTVTSREGRSVTVHSRLVRSEIQGGELTAAVAFVDRSPDQHRALIELMYSAPDSWDVPQESPMGSLEHVRRIVYSLVGIFSTGRALRRLAPRFPCDFPAILVRPDGHDVAVRSVDVSHHGMGVRVPRVEALAAGIHTTLTVVWNAYERTTFAVRVANVRSERNESVLGMAFVGLNAQQKSALYRHIDAHDRDVEAARKAA
jgi:cellulose synthase (UDP-forming)